VIKSISRNWTISAEKVNSLARLISAVKTQIRKKPTNSAALLKIPRVTENVPSDLSGV